MRSRIMVRSLLGISVLGLALAAASPAGAQDSKVGSETLGVAIVDKGDDAADIKEVGVWYTWGQFGLNLLQSSYSKNWSGGDKGAVSWSTTFKGTAEKQFSERWNWFSRLNLAFGQIHQQERRDSANDDSGELYWQKPEKTSDEIDFESLLRRTTEGGWDPYASLRFQSQFLDVSDQYGRSIAFNPLDFRVGLGLSRAFIDTKVKTLLVRFGLAGRQQSRKFYLDPPDVSDTTDRTNTTDGGLELRVDYVTPLLEERVNWTSRLTAYQPLVYSGDEDFDRLTGDILATSGLPTDIADYQKVIDVDWQNTFVAQITKAIAVNLEVRWIYDKYDNSITPVFDEGGGLINGDAVRQAIRKSGQFKQVLALGVVHTF